MTGRRTGSTVSGDRIYLQGGRDGRIESLIKAAGVVVANAGVRTAIIGGLAVTCRLATAHRATGDVDVVADEPEVVTDTRSAADNLVAAGVAEREEGASPIRVWVEGTKVEIIETAPIDAAEVAEVEPELARLFVLSHRWALESASMCTIGVVGSTVEIDAPVAVPAALVAMKLHALQARNDDRKRASDAWDLFRLISGHSGDDAFRASFAAAPAGLVALVRDAVESTFRDDVTRTRRWIQAYGDPAWLAQTNEAALVDLASDLQAALPG